MRWAAVAKELPGRTDKNCAVRYKMLTSGWERGGGGRRGAGVEQMCVCVCVFPAIISPALRLLLRPLIADTGVPAPPPMTL